MCPQYKYPKPNNQARSRRAFMRLHRSHLAVFVYAPDSTAKPVGSEGRLPLARSGIAGLLLGVLLFFHREEGDDRRDKGANDRELFHQISSPVLILAT